MTRTDGTDTYKGRFVFDGKIIFDEDLKKDTEKMKKLKQSMDAELEQVKQIYKNDAPGPVCNDDADLDGYYNAVEQDLGADPSTPLSSPESLLVLGSCLDGVDNDLDGRTDFNVVPGKGAPGCDPTRSGHLDEPHQVALGNITVPPVTIYPGRKTRINIDVPLFHPLSSKPDPQNGLPQGHTEKAEISMRTLKVSDELDSCAIAVRGRASYHVKLEPGSRKKIVAVVEIDCPHLSTPGAQGYQQMTGGVPFEWIFQVQVHHVNYPGNEFRGLDMIRSNLGKLFVH